MKRIRYIRTFTWVEWGSSGGPNHHEGALLAEQILEKIEILENRRKLTN